MSAASAIETLRAIGAEALSAQTHISLDNVRKLLAGEFEAFSAIQFNGFVTILEREYDVDLSELRSRFAQQAPAQEEPLSEQENDPFASALKAKKRQRLSAAILAALLLVVIAVTYAVLGGGGTEEKIELNNTAIEKAKANMEAMNAEAQAGTQAEAEAIQEAHQSEAAEAAVVPEAVRYDDVIIRPKTTVWLGVIDAETHKRSTRTTDEPWRLDGSKAWLIVTGHGLLTLECGENSSDFSQRKRLLLLYEEGRCRTIDEAEFKARNRGKVW